MGEWNYILIVPISAMLFAIGGTGFKWVRRYILPIFLGCMVMLNGMAWWQAFCLTLGLGIAFSLPYGDSVNWDIRCIVLILYSFPTFVLGVTAWQVVYPLLLIFYFLMSRLNLTAKLFPWKGWELLAGSGMGFIVSLLIS